MMLKEINLTLLLHVLESITGVLACVLPLPHLSLLYGML